MEITLMEMEHHPGSIHHPVHITLKEKVVALDPMLKETLVVLVEEVGIKTPQVEELLIKQVPIQMLMLPIMEVLVVHQLELEHLGIMLLVAAVVPVVLELMQQIISRDLVELE